VFISYATQSALVKEIYYRGLIDINQEDANQYLTAANGSIEITRK
jgi:outer membrane protein assembly factor BamA